jgi:hypothetical protein
MINFRPHLLYRTFKVIGVLIGATLLCVGVVGAIANLFLWFAK